MKKKVNVGAVALFVSGVMLTFSACLYGMAHQKCSAANIALEEAKNIEPIVVEVIKEVPVENNVSAKSSEPVQEKEMAYNVTEYERELLARITYLEANNQNQDGQRAVVSVVLNRVEYGYWGDTIYDVLFAKGQFTPAYKINQTTPTESNYEAVDYVLENGATVPEWVMFFRTDYHFSWDGYTPYAKIHDMYFGGFQ